MKFIAAIKNKKAVYAYSGEPLSDTHVAKIEEFIRQTPAPFGANVRVLLLRGNPKDDETSKLGIYGRCKNTCDFLVSIYKKAPLAEEAAAYVLEEVILFCSNLGLGTHLLVDQFNHENFLKRIQLKPGEILKMVTPVGYPSQRRRNFRHVVMDDNAQSGPYKLFEKLFFNKNFDTPLHEDQAGIYAEPLEMVRLGFFSLSKQSYCIVLDKNKLHFYKLFSEYAAADIGIALCYFEQSCIELDIKGYYKVMRIKPKNNKYEYVISWISKQKQHELT
jgi:hypothetical protein